MTDQHHNSYAVAAGAGNTCFSVRGNHAWAGEGPSFFIPAAKLNIGRIISVFGTLVRKAVSRVCRICRKMRDFRGSFALPCGAGCGRVAARRL